MTDDPASHAPTAADLTAAEDEGSYRELLQSVVDVARAIYGAKAASVFVLDEERDELVFEAVSGAGSGEGLVGQRLPSSTGIAGWVLVTRQPLVVDDLGSDPRFNRRAAESTGYVPSSIVAAPLLHDERALGVLEVLDRPTGEPFGLAEMDLLTAFATQAAIGLDLLQRARRARVALGGGDGRSAALGRLAAALEDAEDGGDVIAVLEALERILRRRA